MLVRDVMSRDVVTCDMDTTLQQVVEKMLHHDVGSVIVTRKGEPTDIVTESDALQTGYATERPFTEIPIETLTDGAIVTIVPDATVRRAADRMIDEQVKKLPVVDGLDLAGIITHTDIVHHLTDLREEAIRLAEAHYDWER